MNALLNATSSNDFGWIEGTIAALSLFIAYLAFLSTRRKDLYDVIFNRSEHINKVWKEQTSIRDVGYTKLEPLIKYGRTILDQDYEIWSPLVTELVQTLDIIDMLAKSSIIRLKRRKYYQLLKKAINVEVLDTVMNRYDDGGLKRTDDNNIKVFAAQMERVRTAFESFN